MTTATKEYLERYKARESFVGEDGRTYKMRLLRPAELFRLRDMFVGADSATFNVYTLIGSICEVYNGDAEVVVSFARNRGELESLLNSVGLEPLQKDAAKAFNKLNGGEDTPKEDAEADAA